MNFSALCTISVTFGPVTTETESNNCTFLDETAKIGISQQLQDRSLAAF